MIEQKSKYNTFNFNTNFSLVVFYALYIGLNNSRKIKNNNKN